MPLQVNNARGELVIDPYKSAQWFEQNYEKRLQEFPAKDKDIVHRYLSDMLRGRNVNGTKGPRSYCRIKGLLGRLHRISVLANELYGLGLTELSADKIIDLFESMRNGTIRRLNGTRYISVYDYIKAFKAFWNWYRKVKRKEYYSLSEEQRRLNNYEYAIEDITVDLSTQPDSKPLFVYFTLDSLQEMMDSATYFYKVLMLFLFDSGIRPTEFKNVKAKDINIMPNSQWLELHVRDETSKTFGRKIKLILSSKLLRDYLRKNNFAKEDFLFPVHLSILNQYLKRLSKRVFGKNLERLKENTADKRLAMYDFRHSSACYWASRYPTERGLMWRFGWTSSKMVNYYTEFLGMKDNITEDNLHIGEIKTTLEKELGQEKQRAEILRETMEAEKKTQEKQIERLTKQIADMKSLLPQMLKESLQNNPELLKQALAEKV